MNANSLFRSFYITNLRLLQALQIQMLILMMKLLADVLKYAVALLKMCEFIVFLLQVLFPLLSKLLEHINPQDPSGIEETRMRASTLLCKVYCNKKNCC
jgi:hypothetical protein